MKNIRGKPHDSPHRERSFPALDSFFYYASKLVAAKSFRSQHLKTSSYSYDGRTRRSRPRIRDESDVIGMYNLLGALILHSSGEKSAMKHVRLVRSNIRRLGMDALVVMSTRSLIKASFELSRVDRPAEWEEDVQFIKLLLQRSVASRRAAMEAVESVEVKEITFDEFLNASKDQ